MTDRPGGIKTLSIFAIVLGSMGLAGVLIGLGAQLAQNRIPVPDQGPKFAELNEEYRKRLHELNRGMMPFYWAHLPLAVAASGLLLAGGVLGLKFRGRSVLKAAFGGSLAVDLAAVAMTIVAQLRTTEVVTWYVKEMSALSGQPGMAGLVSGSMMASLAMVVGWFLAKAVLYVWGLVYLSKPEVRAAYGAAAPA